MGAEDTDHAAAAFPHLVFSKHMTCLCVNCFSGGESDGPANSLLLPGVGMASGSWGPPVFTPSKQAWTGTMPTGPAHPD